MSPEVLDENQKMMENLEKAFGKGLLNTKDKGALIDGMSKNNDKNKENFDKTDLDKGIESAINTKIEKSTSSLPDSKKTELANLFKNNGIIDNIRNEADPKEKIKMFQDAMNILETATATDTAEKGEQGKKFSEEVAKGEKENNNNKNDYTTKIKKLAESIGEALIKQRKETQKNQADAQKGGRDEQTKAQSEAPKILADAFPPSAKENKF